MVAVSPVIKDNQMGSKNRQKLVHSAAHFLGTLTGTVRPPSIWKLKEFTELYACLNHLKLEPNDHRQEQINFRIGTELYPLIVSMLTLHTVSFDWFLSGLEWILNFEFCFTKTFDILPEVIMEYQI